MPRKPPIKQLGEKDHAKRVAAVEQAAADAGMCRVLLAMADATRNKELAATLRYEAEHGRTHRRTIDK